MKVLADTCAWSLSLRRRNKASLSDVERRMAAALGEAIQDGRVAIIGPIRQEILSGVKDPAQFMKLRETLQAFVDEQLTTLDYEEAARLFNLCRSHGVECGPVDMLICTVAVQRRWSILTNDRGLKDCMEVVEAEGFPSDWLKDYIGIVPSI